MLLALAAVMSLELTPSAIAISPINASPLAPLLHMEMPIRIFCIGHSRTRSALRQLTLTAVFANTYRLCFSQVPRPMMQGKWFMGPSFVESF